MTEGYQSLTVWQKSMDLAKEVYRIVGTLPKEERYGLADQLRRAAVSIPSNIAEGSRRKTKGEFGQFIGIAHGSLAEVETQLLLARNLYRNVDIGTAMKLSEEVGRMLYGLGRKLG